MKPIPLTTSRELNEQAAEQELYAASYNLSAISAQNRQQYGAATILQELASTHRARARELTDAAAKAFEQEGKR